MINCTEPACNRTHCVQDCAVYVTPGTPFCSLSLVLMACNSVKDINVEMSGILASKEDVSLEPHIAARTGEGGCLIWRPGGPPGGQRAADLSMCPVQYTLSTCNATLHNNNRDCQHTFVLVLNMLFALHVLHTEYRTSQCVRSQVEGITPPPPVAGCTKCN